MKGRQVCSVESMHVRSVEGRRVSGVEGKCLNKWVKRQVRAGV